MVVATTEFAMLQKLQRISPLIIKFTYDISIPHCYAVFFALGFLLLLQLFSLQNSDTILFPI